MRFKIYIDGAVQDATDSLGEAKVIYHELVDDAMQGNFPVRIVLKDLRTFEDIDVHMAFENK